MIAIVDYGRGNLQSVLKAFEHLGYQASITRQPAVLQDASHVVFPGQGAFPDCMKNLEQFDLIEPIRQAIKSGKPFLGICLGLQLLFSRSEEFGLNPGMDIINGEVHRFKNMDSLKVPHMGWNQLSIVRENPILRGVQDKASVYFVHSYYVAPKDPDLVSTLTDYGTPFVSSVFKDNIFACQFHPEKSQSVGLKILDNFAQWNP